jgi:hypothetical protein
VAEGTTPESVGPLMARDGIVVYEMTSSGESLEQLFFELTEGAERGGRPMGQAPGPDPGASPPGGFGGSGFGGSGATPS